MKNTFETKENYINFKTRWATYFNGEARKLDRDEYGTKQRKLTAFHFALYAILQGKDPLKGLTAASGATWDLLEYHSTSTYNQRKMMKFFDITEQQTDKLFEIAQHYFVDRKSFSDITKEPTELENA